MTTLFKDHFSGHAEKYQKYRPQYPDKLFDYLATCCTAHQTAWDCATGNGQAALALAKCYRQVIATDASVQQIANAVKQSNIDYRVAPAESTTIAANSIDLVTVAQALHWFDIRKFAEEVRRVLKPAGILAVWTYNLLQISPGVDYHCQ